MFGEYIFVANSVWSPDLGKVCVIGNTNVPNFNAAVSSDGLTWTYGTASIQQQYGLMEWSTTYKVFCVFLRAQTNVNQCMISADGLNWYNSNAFAITITNQINGLTWSPELERFCLVGLPQSSVRPYVFVSKLLT
jgi:hypothetical protein